MKNIFSYARNVNGLSHLLILGMFLFFCLRFSAVLMQTAAMGGPRLGDDALVHLWRGHQLNTTGIYDAYLSDTSSKSELLRSIYQTCLNEQTYTVEAQVAICKRMNARFYAPSPLPLANVVMALVLKAGLPLKWTFAAFEAIVLGALTIGIAVLLSRLFSADSAGIALIILSTVTMPGSQGIHQYIPSVMALGLSMIVWGLVLSESHFYKKFRTCLWFLPLATVHPVSIVIGTGAVLSSFIERKSTFILSLSRLIPVIGVGVAFAIIVAMTGAIGTAFNDNSSWMLLENAKVNISQLPNFIIDFFSANLVFATLIIPALWMSRQDNLHSARRMLAVLASISALTLFYITTSFTNRFPLDLFSRVFVIFVVIAAGFVAHGILKLCMKYQVRSYVIAPGIAALLAAFSVPIWQQTITNNVNGRREIISTTEIKSFFGSSEKNIRKVLFSDPDFDVAAFLLADVGNVEGVISPVLPPSVVEKVLDEKAVDLVVLPFSQRFNVLSELQVRSLHARKIGVPAQVVDIVRLDNFATPVDKVWLQISGHEVVDIGHIGYMDMLGNAKSHDNIQIDAGDGTSVWVTINFGEPVRKISLVLSDGNYFVTGILFHAPTQLINWPWEDSAELTFRYRNSEYGKRIVFQPSAFWENSGISNVEHFLRGYRVASDSSGFVFLVPAEDEDYPQL